VIYSINIFIKVGNIVFLDVVYKLGHIYPMILKKHEERFFLTFPGKSFLP